LTKDLLAHFEWIMVHSNLVQLTPLYLLAIN